MPTDVVITTDDILKAIGKTAAEKWKLISVILFFAATMFFAGGYYVYSDAKNDAREMKLKAYEALVEVQSKKEEISKKLKELDDGVADAQKALENIVEKLNASAAEYERATKALVQEQNMREESSKKNEIINNRLLAPKEFGVNKDIFSPPKDLDINKDRFKVPNLPQIQQKMAD